MPQRRTFWINAYQSLLQLWEGLFSLVFLALGTMNVHGRSFAYLTNVPSYECPITCWCFRWKERFSVLWKCPTYRVTIFVIFPKGLTHGLSLKIENWTLFVFVLNRPKNSVCWCFRWKERCSGLWKCPNCRCHILFFFPKGLTHGLSLKIEIWPLFVFCFK